MWWLNSLCHRSCTNSSYECERFVPWITSWSMMLLFIGDTDLLPRICETVTCMVVSIVRDHQFARSQCQYSLQREETSSGIEAKSNEGKQRLWSDHTRYNDRATMIYVLCAALNSCNLGYDIGVSTNVSKLIQNDIHITDAQREIWIGFINFWASKLRLYLVFWEL